MFQTGHYPKSWSLGIIHVIHKAGDIDDTNNYRGITVGTALSKVYAMVLNTRMSGWAERHNVRAVGQAGFRKDFRTTDQHFVLQALKDRYKANNKKLFCCFVDFKKAFDLVNRSLLWHRLRLMGITGNILTTIQSMYANVTLLLL